MKRLRVIPVFILAAIVSVGSNLSAQELVQGETMASKALQAADANEESITYVVLKYKKLPSGLEYKIMHKPTIAKLIKGIHNCKKGNPVNAQLLSELEFYLKDGGMISIPICFSHVTPLKYVGMDFSIPGDYLRMLMELLGARLVYAENRTMSTGFYENEVRSCRLTTGASLLAADLWGDMLREYAGKPLESHTEQLLVWRLYINRIDRLRRAKEYDEAVECVESFYGTFKYDSEFFFDGKRARGQVVRELRDIYLSRIAAERQREKQSKDAEPGKDHKSKVTGSN